MKFFFLTLCMVLVATNAFAKDGSGASIELPIGARIINLATMPVEEAIAFCDQRNMACPAIRERYETKLAQANTTGTN